MRIGLVDVDSHARKKQLGCTVYPNLALCKIAGYYRSRGDQVEWALPFEHYDIIYMSKIFNFSPDVEECYIADEVYRGGTGYDISKDLPEEIDFADPDYSIYPSVPTDTAYGFLTRGCPNKCKWCVVPVKEGKIKPYMDIDKVACGRKKVILMDNNILAAGDYAVQQLKKIIQKGYRIDFNQAMDARLVTEEYAELLAQVHWIERRIRFGCDSPAQIKACENAMKMIDSYGFKGQYFLYTMINSDFNESYSRIHYWWEKNNELRKTHTQRRVYPYAQPYRDPKNVNDIPQWQKYLANWTNKKMIFESIDFQDFEPRKGFRCSEYIKQFSDGK